MKGRLVKDETDDPIPAYREARGSNPLIMAWVLAAVIVVVILMTAQNLDWGERREVQDHVQAFYYLATIFAATIAMIIAVWRGVVANRQANAAFAQIRLTTLQLEKTEQQLKHTERQIATAEENNLANLFEKGAALASDLTAGKALAGLSLMRYVAQATNSPFTVEVMQTMTGILSGQTIDFQSPSTKWAAFQYIQDIARKTNSPVNFKGVTVKDRLIQKPWPKMSGVSYADCTFAEVQLSIDLVYADIESCRFITCMIDRDDGLYGRCTFIGCIVSRATRETGSLYIAESGEVAAWRFRDCDFSSCNEFEITDRDEFNRCFYYRDTPPEDGLLRRLGDRLEVRDRPHHRPSS